MAKYRFSKYSGGYFTVDRLAKQNRLKVYGTMTSEIRREVEWYINTDLAALASNELDWLINFGAAQMEIWCDSTGWDLYVRVNNGRQFHHSQEGA